MCHVLITAHSGCEGTPDNPLDSVRLGKELGADCVEIDVRQDASGVLRLTHDLPRDFSAVPTLEEAFQLVAGSSVCINCDLKEYGALYPTLSLAEACGLARAQLALSGSVDVSLLAADPSIAHRARVFLNSEELCRAMAPNLPWDRDSQTAYLVSHAREVAALMLRLGAECLNAPYAHLPCEAMAVLRNAGIKLSLWTVNDPEDQARLLREDILNLTTRNVRSVLRLRNK